jgi:hypothetical protein
MNIWTKYKLSIGAAQNTQPSKALAAGKEKNIFVLSKGPFYIHLFFEPKTDIILQARLVA